MPANGRWDLTRCLKGRYSAVFLQALPTFVVCECKLSVVYRTLGNGEKVSLSAVESSWNVMEHGDAREGKWRGNWRMQWVASILHTTSEHGVSSITTADAHTSAASSRLNWRHPGRFKWALPFRRKTKSGFCACAITFQTQSTSTDRCIPRTVSKTRRASCCVEWWELSLHTAVQVELSLYTTLKAYEGSRRTAPLIISCGNIWRRLVNLTLRPLYLLERTPVSIKLEAGWAVQMGWTL